MSKNYQFRNYFNFSFIKSMLKRQRHTHEFKNSAFVVFRFHMINIKIK